MSRYSYTGVKDAYTGVNKLIPTPAWGSSAQNMTASVGAKPGGIFNMPKGGKRAIALAFLAEAITNILGRAATSLTQPGGVVPSAPQGGSSSKFMLTLQDVKEIQRYVNEENWRRSILNKMGGAYEYLDANEMIREREGQLRRSAAEAGARQYAIESLKTQAAVQPAIAQMMGTSATAGSSLGEEALRSGIGSRPTRDITAAITEIGRSF